MKKTLKPLMLLGIVLIAVQGLLAQSIPTIEMPRLPNVLANSNYGLGSSVAPVVTEFKNDNANNSVFTNYVPQSTFSVALANQQFTGLSYGTANYNGQGVSTLQTTGLVFGIGPSLVSDPTPQGGNPYSRYNIIGEYGGNGGPTNSMFTSNPTATGAQLGTGINVANASTANLNGAVQVFTTAQALYNNPAYPIGSRVYFGDLILTFNQPVKNPVIHIAGLGGSYRYLPSGAPNTPANYLSTFFSTELELSTPGLTSTLLSGNQFITVSGNNILNNNDVNPNGGSVVDPTEFINNLGAATGSLRINGTVQTLVYRVYLQGGSGSQFAWSAPGTAVSGPAAPRDPFTGDIWYVAASYDKPTQQIFGNVFIDPQTTDNNINQSFGNPNARTNASGLLYANLISGGLVVATVPVSDNGDYLLDNIPVGSYTVQLSSNQGVVGSPQPGTALPSNWINTGEFIGAGAGTDGTVNGISSSFTVNAFNILTNVNFGIKAGVCPGNVLYQNPIALTGYFGGFEVTPAAANFFPTGVNYGNGRGRIYPATPLAPADYSITSNPNLFSNTLSSYPALGGQNQMVVKPSATNQVAYYIMDSAGRTNSGFQIMFFSGPGPAGDYNFRGWFSKSTAADAIVKIRIYDADVPSRVFKDINITVTGAAGNWVYWTAPWNVNYGVPGNLSLTKKVRFDIISVNGAPFSIDELCFDEPALGPPLAIKISDFTVNKTDCNANLVWKTATESNSDRFEIEVSTSTNPVYTNVSTVLAAGNSSTPKSYQFSYPMQAGVVYFFRLKLIDKAGTFKYSDIVSASCSKGGGGITIGPNPTKEIFTVRGMETGKNLIGVYASNGQLIKNQTTSQTQEVVDISHLAPGVYMVKITSEAGNTVISKLIKY